MSQIKFNRQPFEGDKSIFLQSKCQFMVVNTISAFDFPDNFSLIRPTQKDKEKRMSIIIILIIIIIIIIVIIIIIIIIISIVIITVTLCKSQWI